MKWFKHYSDMHDGRSINNLMDELGHTGLCFYLLQEMCAEKFDATEKNLDETSATFSFHPRIVRQKLRISPVKLERLLSVCSANGLLSFQIHENSLEIKMPILLKLLDRDAKNARKTRAESAQKTRLEIEIELEKEIEKEPEGKVAQFSQAKSRKASPSAPVEKVQDLIALYCDLWKARYKTNDFPSIGGKAAGQFKILVKDFGFEKSKSLVEAYLQMPDRWFITRRHDVQTLLTNLNSVTQFASTGRLITKREIDSLDRRAANHETLRAIEAGEI